jgi:hypothetical protein
MTDMLSAQLARPSAHNAKAIRNGNDYGLRRDLANRARERSAQ